MLRISILGPFLVERDGQVVAPGEWARPKDRALLKILALESGHLVPQDRLLELLWPDLSPTAAAKSLFVSVSRLRKVIASAITPSHPVQRQGAGYMLVPGDAVWIDLDAFRRLVTQGKDQMRRGAWAAATEAFRSGVALYRGDLFEDDPYEEWAIRPREQVRETHLSLLEDLAQCLLQIGSPAEAIEFCEQGLVHDQTREALYAPLMRAHQAAGRHAEALQAFERCRLALAEELGVVPGAAVCTIRDELLDMKPPVPHIAITASAVPGGSYTAHIQRTPRQMPSPGAPGPLHLPWVGREKEQALLESGLTSAQAGQGQLLLIHGEPGIGKSRLLEEFARIATEQGARVLKSRCYEMERDLPFAPIAEAFAGYLAAFGDPKELSLLLGPWGAQIATLLPFLRDRVPSLPLSQPLRPDAERAAMLAGLTHLLLSLGRQASLTLLLDDLQWADETTVQWLHYLTRRLRHEPVLIVGAYRTSDVDLYHPIQRLLGSLAGEKSVPALLELSCLTAEHVASLIPAISGSASHGSALASRLHRETDGHPLFLAETLRTLFETGVLRLDGRGSWVLGRPGVTFVTPGHEDERLPIPASLRQAILWRVRRLDEPARRLLAAAAVAEHGFTGALIARMTDLTSEVVFDGLETLVDRQFVQPVAAGSAFDFRHDLLREVVYGDLGTERRRWLHGRAAASIEALARDRSLDLRERAGELAHHWRLAAQWTAAHKFALLAGDHARDTFAPREALAHYSRAAEAEAHHPELFDAADKAALLQRLGRAHAEVGDLEVAVRHFEALRTLAQETQDGMLEGRALVALSDAELMRHNFGRAEQFAAAAAQLVEELGNRELLIGTRMCSGNVAIALGRTADAERHCSAVLALADEWKADQGEEAPGVLGAQLNAMGWLGLLWQWQGEHDRATPAIEASLQLGRELNNPFLTGRSRFASSMSLGNRGRYEEALTALHEALRLSEEAGDRYFFPRHLNTVGWIYSELGDLRQAEDWNRRSIAVARETGWLEAEANALVNMGMDALSQGDQTRAREAFEQATALIDRDEWFTWRYRIRLLIGLAELALAGGHLEKALALANQARTLAEPTASRKHVGRSWLITGRAMLAAGARAEQVLPYLERARSLALTIENPPLAWTSGAALAGLHASMGHQVEADECWAASQAAVQRVAATIGDPALRRSFLGLPSVQSVIAAVPLVDR
jgi:DNA-binding SARP family transcriptional activator